MSNTYDADHRWQNMCAMLDRLGLDALELAHGRLASDLRSAVTSCQHCRSDKSVRTGWSGRRKSSKKRRDFARTRGFSPPCAR